MVKVLLSHAGKQHSYHVARSLNDLGYLDKFYTSSYITSSFQQQCISRSGNQFWSRRFIEGLSGDKVEANWRFELKEMLFSKLYGQTKKTLNAVYQRDIRFDRYMAGRMKKLGGSIFWGFQGSCLESLRSAKMAGKLAVCELSTAHAPAAIRILREEQRLHPEWSDSFDNLEFPPDYYHRLCEEPQLADLVLGASAFTLETLKQEGIERSKLRYLPLGFEAERIPFMRERKRNEGPLRLLYAGRVTQRKGIKYLLEAVNQFTRKDVELHIIGNIQGTGRGLKMYDNYIHHASVSQAQLFDRYQHYDAFVLPSVFEGFGLVIVEALAAGLPVITTPHTIGRELIVDSKNGYLVPVRDVNAIVEAIKKLLVQRPEELLAMRLNARDTALQYTWSAYTLRLRSFIESL